MTLRPARYTYFPMDHDSSKFSLKYFTSTDLKKQSKGRRNINNIEMLINFMTNTCLENCIFDKKLNEKEDSMYHNIAGYILSLSNNTRLEIFS